MCSFHVLFMFFAIDSNKTKILLLYNSNPYSTKRYETLIYVFAIDIMVIKLISQGKRIQMFSKYDDN